MVVLKWDQVQFVIGKLPVHPVPQVHKGLGGVEQRGSHTEGPAIGIHRLPCAFHGAFGILKQEFGVLIDHLSRRRQANPVRRPLDQLQFQVGL